MCFALNKNISLEPSPFGENTFGNSRCEVAVVTVPYAVSVHNPLGLTATKIT
jgi:hypothetical protein